MRAAYFRHDGWNRAISYVCWIHRRTAFALIALVLCVAQRHADAHQFTFAHGTAILHPDRMEITLECDIEDLRHFPPPAPSDHADEWADRQALAIERYRRNIAERLILRDADGRRISGELVPSRQSRPSMARNDDTAHQPPTNPPRVPEEPLGGSATAKKTGTETSIQVSLIYAIDPATTILTFQQAPGGELSGLRSQWVLAVRREGEQLEQLVRLTSGGNTETVEFGAADTNHRTPVVHPAPPGETGEFERLLSSVMHNRKYNGMFAVLRENHTGLTLEVHTPLTLVETFIFTSRADTDFVEVAEQEDILARWSQWVTSRILITIDGRESPCTLQHQAFLAPNDQDAAAAAIAPGRLGAFTARTLVRLNVPVPEHSSPVELSWKLFNARVLVADIVYDANGHPVVRELTTYHPTVIVR